MTGFFEEQEVDEPARPLTPITPRYPPTLRRLGVEGSVTARVAVRIDGSVGAATLLASTHPGFTGAARDALRDARFEPARRGGRPVASWIRLEIGFELGH